MFHIINIARAGIISDAPTIPQLLLKVLSFLLSIFGFIAIISVVISGIIYVTSAGDENRISQAKKMFLYSIIGIAVALGSLIIVNTISRFL